MIRKYKSSLPALVLLSLLTLTLTGCAGMDVLNDIMDSASELFADEDASDPPATLDEEFKGEIEVEEIWKESVGVGAENKFLKLIPAVRDGRVYVGEYGGTLQARAVADGDVVWEDKTDYHFAAGPALATNMLIMGTIKGEVIAYDDQTGQEKWVSHVSSEVLATPVIKNNKVMVRTTDGKIFALNLSNGATVWSAETSLPALSIRGAGAPLCVSDMVVIGSANGKLTAMQQNDGKALWEATVVMPSGRSEVERLVDLDTDPVYARNYIFISSYQGGTAAISEADGDVIWRNDGVSSYSGIFVEGRYLYISDTHSEIWQLDQRNGASLWKQKDLHNRQLSAAVVYQNYVVAGDFEGYVHWLSTVDGHVLGRIRVGKSPISTKPVVVDGVVYVYAKDGTLAALRVK